MAYCTNCGAYIPDGETVCVACGMDSAAVQTPASSTSAAFAAQMQEAKNATEELRDTLEQKHREQQDKNREWAAQAYSDFKSQKANKTSERTGGVPAASKKPDSKKNASTSKLMAGLSYISFLCFLPFIFSSQSDDFAKYHGKQGILLFAASAVIDILGKFSGMVGLVLSVLRIYLIYKGIKNVVEEKKEPLPFIGQYAEKF